MLAVSLSLGETSRDRGVADVFGDAVGDVDGAVEDAPTIILVGFGNNVVAIVFERAGQSPLAWCEV